MKNDNVKCRILHVFGALNRGGAETMIMNIYRNIDRSKVQFDFIVHTEEKCDYDEEIKNLGGRIYRVSKYTGRNHFKYKKEWYDFFKQHREYKIIHGHVRSTASIYLSIAKKYKLKTISHSHNTSSGTGISAVAKNILQYRIRYFVDYMFACSNESGVWLFGKEACKKKNFFILKNAIETEKYIYNEETRHKVRKELDLKDKFVIGHIGRFHPQKNHDFLIDVFKEMCKRDSEIVLILIGNGELKNQIEKKVSELGLNLKVIFMGIRSDIEKLVQAMDIVIFPSLYEGLPVTLIEVQAAGLPCIVSDRITKSVKITDTIKYLSLDQSKEEWAQKALKYKKNTMRKNMYEEIVKAGYDIKSTSEWYQKFCEINSRG